jgi:hypothetical protein
LQVNFSGRNPGTRHFGQEADALVLEYGVALARLGLQANSIDHGDVATTVPAHVDANHEEEEAF